MTYGDSIATVKRWFNETMLKPNIRGYHYINDLFKCNHGNLTNAFSFEIVGISFEKLDSLEYPLTIFESRKEHPYILKNNLRVGAENPISFATFH